MSDASLLIHKLDVHIALADNLQASLKVHLEVIPTAYYSLYKLVTFSFVASFILSAVLFHATLVVDILRIFEIVEELNIEVQGMLALSKLTTNQIFDMRRHFSYFLIGE